MSNQPDQRKYPRLSISGQTYEVRFQIQGSAILDTRLVNLSAGGCGLEVQIAQARSLEVGMVLEELFLDHPDLPLVPLSAVILRILGKVPGKTSGYILLGVEFEALTPFLRELIAAHVDAQLGGS